jgi:aminoglycoside phosphotransferase (APT) family kinase protein
MPDLLDHPTTVRRGEELDLSKLEALLRSHFPNELGPVNVRQFPSGHSNLTYSLQIGSSEFVLRRPPFGSKVKSAHDMSREFRVLSKLHSVYAPAPNVLFYCDDESILGVPFYLMEPIHGVILRRDPPPGLDFPPEKARCLSESFVENLALLHSLDYAAVGLADLGKPQGYLARQVRGWIERYHGSKTHDHPEV